MPNDNFRTTTLTLLGAAGYLVSLSLVVLKAVGVEIPWRVIAYPALTASVLLNVDLAIDVLPVQVRRANDSDTTKDDRDNQ